ncbi:MAG: ABC transporter ATP-binding protein [Deltaproteobacteria bacterium]|jgi:ABC-type lipoprotein export system ATPase subunit|nr:ABC transporter ATP-binding protein [Deltaproteobacteria bacterium]
MYIECEDLLKTYRSEGAVLTAVDHVDLEVKKGDFVIIMGHSGSGKTTLLSLIGGLTRPSGGRVRIENIDNWQQSDGELAIMRNKKIGFIFQFASLMPTLTVLENILLPLSFSNTPQGDRQYALELLERVGLRGRQDDLPGQLSGGQQRRVAIARSFINRPAIILADEPTGDLDETTEQEILAIFKTFNQAGITFLVVTHNTDLALSQDAPRLFTMQNGLLEAIPPL